MIQKFLLFLFFLFLTCQFSYSTLTPARNVTTTPNTFSKCIPSATNDVQTSLNDLDACIGASSGNPGGVNTQYQINNNGVFGGGNMYNVGGNVGVGSTAPGALLDVNGLARVKGFNLSAGSNPSGKVLTSDANGNGTWQSSGSGGGTVNPGTAGDFPYYASTGNIVSDQSVLTFNGTNIGINYASPTVTLQVGGTTQATLFVGPGAIGALSTGYIPEANSSVTLGNSVMNQVGGNVGLNTTNPGQQLDIMGTVRSIGSVIGNLSGVLKGTSGVVGTATSGTDYAPATSGTSILKGNGSGGFSNAVAGTDYEGPLTFSTGLTNSAGTVVVNNSQNIVQLSNLTSNGLVTTTSSNGTLSVVPFSGVLGLWETNAVGIDTFNPVGIGSTNPGQQLDVNGTIRGLGFQGDSGGALHVSSNQGIGLDSVNSSYATPVLYLTTAGNVGVGSVTPGTALDVNGTTRTTGFTLSTNPSPGYILTSNNVGAGTWAPAPASTPPGGSATQLQYNTGSAFGGVSGSGVVGNNVGIGSVNPEYGLVAYGGAKINGTGTSNFGSNVGIGSTAAGQALDVNGTIRMTGITVSAQGAVNGYVLTASDSSGDATWHAASASGTNYWGQNGNNIYPATVGNSVGIGTALPFTQFESFGTNQSVYILSNGNVGIGPVTPAVPLDVTGTLRTTNFTLTGNNATLNYVLTATNSSGQATWQVASAGSPAGGINAVQYNNPVGTFAGKEAVLSFNGTNVGIGTTNGRSLLDVEGTISTSGFNVITNGNVGIGSVSPISLFDVEGTVTLRAFEVQSNGNVGIGTFNANEPLVIGSGSNGFYFNGTTFSNIYNNATINAGEGTFNGYTYTSPDSGGITLRGTDSSSGPSGVTLRGGNNGNSNNGGGAVTINGGNITQTSGDSGLPGNLSIQPGGNYTTSGQNGFLQVNQTFQTANGNFAKVNDIACLTANQKVGDCGVAATNPLGVGIGTTTPSSFGIVQTAGIATQVPFDGTYTPSAGWYACTSPTTAGEVLPQAAPCGSQRQVGIIVQGATGVGVGTFMVQPGGEGGYIANNVGIGSLYPSYPLTVIGNVGISTTNAASLSQGCNGSGVTSCVCKQFEGGICVSCTCT